MGSGATIRMGSTDVVAVKEAQYYLVNLNYLPANTAPGVFGPIMDGAVKAFQKTNGLVVDGVIGPATWQVLGSRSAITAGGTPLFSSGSYTPGPPVSSTAGTAGAGAGPRVNATWSFDPMDIEGRMPTPTIAQRWAALGTPAKLAIFGLGLGGLFVVFGSSKGR